MFLRSFFSFIFIVVLLPNLSGQSQFNELPVQFLQLSASIPQINPAYAAVDSGVTLTTGNKMNFGSFRVFRTHYFNAISRLPFRNLNSRNNHGIGLTLLTDRDGDYIQHNRFYFNYAFKIRLATHWSLATGASIGAENISIESSSISPPGSSMRPDASVGIWLQRKRSFIGIAANQLFNSKITPLQETVRLLPHYNLTFGHRQKLSQGLEYVGLLNFRIIQNLNPDIDFQNMILISNFVSTGFNYRHHKGMVVILGFQNIPFKLGRQLASGWFSYNIPFSKYVINNLQTYEITLCYKIL